MDSNSKINSIAVEFHGWWLRMEREESRGGTDKCTT